jgi:hypothetical protein
MKTEKPQKKEKHFNLIDEPIIKIIYEPNFWRERWKTYWNEATNTT